MARATESRQSARAAGPPAQRRAEARALLLFPRQMLRASLLTLVVAWAVAAARLVRPRAAWAMRQLRTRGPRA